jgi:DNA uptake protein ComE-like DNA-binding protein
MQIHRTMSLALLSGMLALFTACIGCSSNPNDRRTNEEKTRDEVAKATERAKPAVQEAGHELDEAAHEAAGQVKAAAQGVRDGLNNTQQTAINVNSATEDQLRGLPGIDGPEARKIIDNRPYNQKHDLVDKGVLSTSTYDKIRDQITAK